MANLADEIERLILLKLIGEQEEVVILQRNELADELRCAPSQISYVLNTRFSAQRGFLVESRRGSGGFIRIARIPLQNFIFRSEAEQLDTHADLSDALSIVERLERHGLITSRENLLLRRMIILIYRYLPPQDRTAAIQSLFLAMDKTKGNESREGK